MAITLATIVVGQVGAVLNCRTDRQSIFRRGLFTNRLVLFGIGVELVLLAAFIYAPPLQAVLGTAPLSPRDWAFVLVVLPIMVGADELRKAGLRWRARR